MTYYPDFSPYTETRLENGHTALNIGWLDPEHVYSHGPVPESFLDRLWAFCRQPVFKSRGYYGCKFCRMPDRPIIEQRRGERLQLSWAQIRAVGRDGTVYAAPDLIYHYAVAHSYCPPQEFVQAVMETPLPDSQEYEVLKKEKGLDIDIEKWILRARRRRLNR